MSEEASLEQGQEKTTTRRVCTSGTLYWRGDRPGWWISYRDPRTGRRVRRNLGPDKAEAKASAAKIQAEVREHGYFEPKKASQTRFDDAVAAYLKWAETNKLSWHKDEQYLRRLAQDFGGRALVDVTPATIEAYKSARIQEPVRNPGRRPRTVSKSTVNHELTCLKHLFNLCVRWEMADSNPMKAVEMFRVNTGRTLYLTPAEVQALIEACGGRLRAMVTLAIHTGMRKGEILGLKWQDIDEGQRTARIVRAKNGESRYVPLNDAALAAVRGCYSERHIETGSPFLFCRGDGRPYQDCHHGYQAALKRAGLGGRGFTFHTLRHSAASLMARAGVPILAVKEILGHKTMAMTLRYAHLFPDQKHDAVRLLGEALGKHSGAESGTSLSPAPKTAC